jgi:ABC-type Fe3+ transport system permease subunit
MKKGISPILAITFLILFSIALAFVVMKWGASSLQEQEQIITIETYGTEFLIVIGAIALCVLAYVLIDWYIKEGKKQEGEIEEEKEDGIDK